MSWVPILFLVLVFVIAPVQFPVFLGGVVLSSSPRVDAFEDATFLHRVVGFWMQLAWSLQCLVIVFLVVSPPVGTLDRIHLVVVVTRALASEVITIVTPPIPTFFVIAAVGATMIPVVETTTTVVSSRKLVGTSCVVPDEFFCIVGVGIIFGRGKDSAIVVGLLRSSLFLSASWKRSPLMKADMASSWEVFGILRPIFENRRM